MQLLADGMVNGLCENCPVCSNATLTQCSGRIVCWGYMNGNTKCVYKASTKDVKRFAFKLPAKIVAKDWMQKFFRDMKSHCVESAGADAPGGGAAAALPPPAAIAAAGGEAAGWDFSKMKLKELQAELKARGLAVSGNKTELVGRLEDAMQEDEPDSGAAEAAAVGVKRGIDETADGGVAIPNQKKKLKSKDDAGPPAAAVAAAAQAAPKREKPMAGSPILEVHAAYKQHGNIDSATVLTEKGGTEVYNAMMTDVDILQGKNRYYVIQALKMKPSGFQFFRKYPKRIPFNLYPETDRLVVSGHEGKVGQDNESIDLATGRGGWWGSKEGGKV